uniref:Putative ovule protein n=1 Tax=Solanum chacoense TaxID=4108 RepID=A0A0V0GNL4_SOLCH
MFQSKILSQLGQNIISVISIPTNRCFVFLKSSTCQYISSPLLFLTQINRILLGFKNIKICTTAGCH